MDRFESEPYESREAGDDWNDCTADDPQPDNAVSALQQAATDAEELACFGSLSPQFKLRDDAVDQWLESFLDKAVA